MHQRPNLPRSLTRRQQIILNLILNHTERVSVDQSEVGEENTHKDGTPDDLIDGHLGEDGDSIGAGNLFVEPVVEVVAGGAVVDEAEEREGGETFPVDGSSSDEDLFISCVCSLMLMSCYVLVMNSIVHNTGTAINREYYLTSHVTSQVK